jgi:hypothetical protein
MATDTAGDQGQEYHTNQVHYVAKTVTFANDDQVVTIGTLPPRAIIIDAGIAVTTAFSGGTPVADMGVGADTDAIASALALGTAGCIRDVSTDPLVSHDDYSTGAVTVNISITSGSTITAGSGVAFVTYIIGDR